MPFKPLAVAVRLAALYSGGKDSTYALFLAQRQGHQIIRLVSIHPREDSMMFHVPNVRWTELQAKALGIPLAMAASGEGEAAELMALQAALRETKSEGVEGVVAGAVASRYQADRIRRIAHDLGMEVLTPLWGMDPAEEVRSLLRDGFKAIFVAVAAEGLGPEWLGRPLDGPALEDLLRLHSKYRIHISGEGGEYETMVLSGPSMRGRIIIDEGVSEWRGQAGVYLIRRAHWEA